MVFHINQREETIDLHGVSGAILATRTMQMQTFLARPACFNPFQSAKFDLCYTEDGSPTLRSGSATAVLTPKSLFENHGMDCRYRGPLETAPSILACYGTGGNNQSLVAQPQAFCLSGNIIDRQPQNGGNGAGVQAETSYTLTVADRHAVCAAVGPTQMAAPYQDVVGALCKGDEKGIGNQYVSQDKCIVMPDQLIRRLTPLECERLQGFPDLWTEISGASDSARYKALGNSVAIPCVMYVMQGIFYALNALEGGNCNT